MRNKNGRLYLQIYAISYIWLYDGSASSLENQVCKLNYHTLYGLNYAQLLILPHIPHKAQYFMQQSGTVQMKNGIETFSFRASLF